MVLGGRKSSVQVPVLPLPSSVTLGIFYFSILIFSIYHRVSEGLTETMCETLKTVKHLQIYMYSQALPLQSSDSLWI